MKLLLVLGALLCSHSLAADEAAPRKTTVSIVGDSFHLNGAPTYAGARWKDC